MFRHLETIALVAPFGTRFMDAVLRTPITEGLRVTAYPDALPQHRIAVPHNNSGAFYLHEGPGLRDFVSGAGDDAYWAAIHDAKKIAYTFEIEDRLGRFLPGRFNVKLPHRGIFTPTCLRAPASSNPTSGVPLYSSPARPLPPGTMVIRAQLWDTTKKRPTAYAVVEAIEGTINQSGAFTAKAGALPYRGISDVNGGLAIILPVPQPDTLKPVKERLKWLFNLTAAYKPPEGGFPPIPDLCAVLEQNQLATLWSAAPATPLAPITLELGREKILKTSGSVTPPSWLHLVPS